MATIGTFHKQDDGSYKGSIKTLTLNVKQATFRTNEGENDKAPDFRVFAGQVFPIVNGSNVTPTGVVTPLAGIQALAQRYKVPATAEDLRR